MLRPLKWEGLTHCGERAHMSEQRNRGEEIRGSGNEAYPEFGEKQADELNDRLRAERESSRALFFDAVSVLFNQHDHPKAERYQSSGFVVQRKEGISNDGDGLARLVDRCLTAAERELSAFFAAVNENFGADQASKSAIDWLEKVKLMDWPIEEETPNWRHATLSACARLGASSPERFRRIRLKL